MKRATRREIPALIAAREPFQGNSMSATANGDGGQGWLNAQESERFYADKARIVYLIRSYLTPIGWVLDDGTTYRVAQRFSMTTSHHQGLLYRLEASL